MMSSVLVLYPSAYTCYAKLERKLNRILTNIDPYQILTTPENERLVARYCGEMNTSHRLIQETEMRAALGDLQYAILFNDGALFNALIADLQQRDIPTRVIATPITRVVNKDQGEPYDVYIGRGTPWGNPHAVGFGGSPDETPNDRAESVRKYRYDFEKGYLPTKMESFHELTGKTLACHCKPLACHGDVIAAYLNSRDDGH